MLRIRGTVGEWPVDLSIEMDESDWAQLGAQLHATRTERPATPVSQPVNQDDTQWRLAKELLRNAGQLTGPDLLEQLEALTGNPSAGKRLLVRLRHSPHVKVVSGGDTPLYSWHDPATGTAPQ